MTALATTSETLAAQTPSGRSFTLWALLGFWVHGCTSARARDWSAAPKSTGGRASVKTPGGLHIAPPGLGHRVADRLRFAKTVAGMDRVLGDSSHRARARDRALRARWRRAGGSACGGVAGAVAPRAGPRPHRTTSGRA